MRNISSPIAILSDGIPPFIIGGMQKHSRLLAEYLTRNGQPVLLYHYVKDDSVPSDSEVRSHFSAEANQYLTIRTFRYPKEDVLPGHYLRGQKSVSKIYAERLLNEETIPRLIYSKGFMAWELLKRRDALPNETRIAVKFHGMNMFQTQPNLRGEFTKWMLRSPVRWIMNSADFVFSYGGRISEVIARELKNEDRIVELSTGIDLDWLAKESNAGLQNKKVKFLFVGRLDRLKGLPELYAALRDITTMDISVSIVGPIPKLAQIADKRISFLGQVRDRDTLIRIYDRHDVLVCPSISEGMPNVILEAMARGLAVIATDVGATSILVDEEIGWLIPAKNKGDLVNALVEASESERLHLKGRKAIARVKADHDWNQIAHSFVEWLKKEKLI